MPTADARNKEGIADPVLVQPLPGLTARGPFVSYTKIRGVWPAGPVSRGVHRPSTRSPFPPRPCGREGKRSGDNAPGTGTPPVPGATPDSWAFRRGMEDADLPGQGRLPTE